MLRVNIFFLMWDMQTKVVFYILTENTTITSVIEEDKAMIRRWSYSTTAIRVAHFLVKPTKPNQFQIETDQTIEINELFGQKKSETRL